MNDRVQLGAQVCVAEDDLAQPLPVQGAVLGQDSRAEHADHLGQAGGVRFDYFPGHHVRVDDQRPVAGQPAGDLALAGADAPGQAHFNHAAVHQSMIARLTAVASGKPGAIMDRCRNQ